MAARRIHGDAAVPTVAPAALVPEGFRCPTPSRSSGSTASPCRDPPPGSASELARLPGCCGLVWNVVRAQQLRRQARRDLLGLHHSARGESKSRDRLWKMATSSAPRHQPVWWRRRRAGPTVGWMPCTAPAMVRGQQLSARGTELGDYDTGSKSGMPIRRESDVYYLVADKAGR